MQVIIAEKKYGAGLKATMESAENSGFMLFNPGERKLSVEGVELFIEHIKKQPHSELFTAIDNQIVAGYLMVRGDDTARTSHRAYLAIGVHEHFRGQGVGKQLLLKVEEWAKAQNVHRLELTVLTKNIGAVHLYEKMGFEKEGTKRNSLKINDQYEDEFFMSKLIE
ncbi:MAG: GNAT family N-acetyltransferase [Kurthia sp.]|nr:GNAT family N-acetyltransferase [Candidatus Kurthia equi]